ncbi:PREDICTED: uncharacterized protein LOC109462296 [Branchiostoma belcheri]|uniref:Uncharacterized protein LOC109462296 n=1 Tax=Branchiostoma belcheri TaxID=7741 RepID=A0A6P4XCX4_BRABE|nr:PREDICTED: uncharacterized protein LOC109462296 [Branchiostoma belcheri]
MAVEKEILEHQKITAEPLKKNISDLERKALAELKKMTNVIIKPADKDSAVVIMKREDYIQEALRQLNNKDHYRKVDHCVSEEHATKKRGYEETLLDAAITRAQERSREDTLQKKTPTAPQDRTVLVTTYSPHPPPLHTVITKYWNLVQLSSRTRDIFQDPPLVAYRRNKNIKDMLVRARIPKENRNLLEKFVPSGSFPCGKNGCTNCAYVKKANNFKSHRTGKCYAIRTHINCQSKNIVYLIQCKKYGVQYVGETKQTLANRLNSHRSAINTCTKKDTPVSAHFNQTHSMGDLEILGIERLCYTGNEDLTRQRRLQRESY